MKILCTKDEFSKILQQCCENRMGYKGCGGCLFQDTFDSENCGKHLVDVCEIVIDGGEATCQKKTDTIG